LNILEIRFFSTEENTSLLETNQPMNMTRKIAVPVNENGILDGHFGHCDSFVVFTEKENTLVSEERVFPPPHEPGVLPRFLAGHGVTDVIAGGMGQRAIQIFNQAGVNVFVGAPQIEGRQLAEGFLNNTIGFAANYCDH
jgi:predicted Fe-Mo cluster-binding NifX family protein